MGNAHEHVLVVLAMGGACWVVKNEDTGEFMLLVEGRAADGARRELHAYDSEQSAPQLAPSLESAVFRYGPGWDVYGVWISALLLTFFWQNKDLSLVNRACSSNIALWLNGEWWRPFTALFLHGDATHLLGNLLCGMLFGTFVAKSVGAWRGWGLILACGTFGNIVAGLLAWPAPLESIGASTAVFGALGILCGIGFATMLFARVRPPVLKTAAPVIAGMVLLGWLGSGQPGDLTDVLGHVSGFLAGLISGLFIGYRSHGDQARESNVSRYGKSSMARRRFLGRLRVSD